MTPRRAWFRLRWLRLGVVPLVAVIVHFAVDTLEAFADPAEPAPPAAEAPPPPPIVGEKVFIGAYVNDIQNLDLKSHTFAGDVYLWFRWTNPAINPATGMDFVNPSDLWGHVRTYDNEEAVRRADGSLYQVVRHQGRFSCKLPLYDYPLDRQTIFMEFEDRTLEAHMMSYVADGAGVEINPDITLPGMTIGTPRLVITDRVYGTSFGESRGAPALAPGSLAPAQGAAAGALDARATSPAPASTLLAGLITSRPHAGKLSFSRARIEVPMSRPPVPHLIKMLLPVVCVVLCASMMFLFRPAYVDSRVELGITSLLTVVALQMTLGQELPDVAYLVLVDKVYVATYLYVMAAIGVVVKTTHLNDDGDAAGALRVNRLGMLTATVTYFSALGLLIIPRLV